jgi:hypothetical protein
MAGIRVRESHDSDIKSRELTMGRTSLILIGVAVLILIVALVMRKKA